MKRSNKQNHDVDLTSVTGGGALAAIGGVAAALDIASTITGASGGGTSKTSIAGLTKGVINKVEDSTGSAAGSKNGNIVGDVLAGGVVAGGDITVVEE